MSDPLTDQKKRLGLKINMPPEEALQRAMMVKPPKDWKKALAQGKKRGESGGT